MFSVAKRQLLAGNIHERMRKSLHRNTSLCNFVAHKAIDHMDVRTVFYSRSRCLWGKNGVKAWRESESELHTFITSCALLSHPGTQLHTHTHIHILVGSRKYTDRKRRSIFIAICSFLVGIFAPVFDTGTTSALFFPLYLSFKLQATLSLLSLISLIIRLWSPSSWSLDPTKRQKGWLFLSMSDFRFSQSHCVRRRETSDDRSLLMLLVAKGKWGKREATGTLFALLCVIALTSHRRFSEGNTHHMR